MSAEALDVVAADGTAAATFATAAPLPPPPLAVVVRSGWSSSTILPHISSSSAIRRSSIAEESPPTIPNGRANGDGMHAGDEPPLDEVPSPRPLLLPWAPPPPPPSEPIACSMSALVASTSTLPSFETARWPCRPLHVRRQASRPLALLLELLQQPRRQGAPHTAHWHHPAHGRRRAR